MLSFRRRLALVHLSTILIVLVVTALSAYWSLSREVHDQLDTALLALARTETEMLDAAPDQPVQVHDAVPGPKPPPFARLDRLVQIVDAQGKVLARSANLGGASLPVPPALPARMEAGSAVFETLNHFADEPVRMVTLPVHTPRGLLAVQVAGSLDDTRNVIASASFLFMVMALTLLATLGLAGSVVTRWVFRAIDDIVGKARHIGETNLNERLPHPGSQDEIGRLVDALNAMLVRLDQSFQLQKRFTSDASHELRSPLSRLRAEIEITLRRPRSPDEYVEALRSCMDEVEGMTLLVEELLALARFDAGQDRGHAESTSLNELAALAVKRVEAVARQRQVTLGVLPSAQVLARIGAAPAALVLSNLLDNALKFTPAGGTIRIAIAAENGQARLTVADTGPGIDSTDMPRLFERFYRGSAARAEAIAGVGLGLSLCQAIVQIHGGRIEASNLPEGGASFSVSLPSGEPPDDAPFTQAAA